MSSNDEVTSHSESIPGPDIETRMKQTIYDPEGLLNKQRWVGERVPRKEDNRHMRGEGLFLDDLPFEGGYIGFVRSPHAHARIRSIDTSRAKSDPRFLAVITGEDVAAETKPVSARSITAEVTQYVMATGKVRWVGEPVVAVAATDMFAARDLVDLIDVEYEPLPAIRDIDDALLPDAPRIYEELDSNVLLDDRLVHGDIELAERESEHVIEETWRVGRFSSTPLEPYALTASYEHRSGTWTIDANDQQPGRSIANLTRAMGVDVASVRLNVPESGGSFGIKLAIWPYMLIACLLARRTDRPLKWIQTRTEHLLGGTHTPDVKMHLKLHVTDQGKFRGLQMHSTENDGAFIHTAGIYGLIKFATLVGPYTIGATDVRLTSVVTNRGPVVQNRGVGKPPMTFALERSVDRAAAKLGLDPVEIRLRNLVEPDQMPYTTPAGEIYESGDYPETMRRAVELSGYEQLRKQQEQARAEGRLFGIGVSAGIEPGTSNIGYYSLLKGSTEYMGNSEGAVVGVEVDGRVRVQTGSVDSGQGHDTTLSQVAADALGVTPDDVVVQIPFDSERSPYTGHSGTYSNRFNDVEVGAVVTAAAKVRAKILVLAAHLLEVDKETLILAGGEVIAAGTGKRIKLMELAKVAYNKPVLHPEGFEPGLRVLAYYANPLSKLPRRDNFNIQLTHSNSVHITAVEIDRDTGMLDFVRYAIVHDCGRRLNPSIVDGMSIGSTVHGLGGALLEEFTYDDACHPLATAFQTYLKPVAQTVPRIELGHLETPCPFTVLGTKAAGEGGAITSLAAVGNAVEDALRPFGGRISSLPITPDKILDAMQRVNA